jgi:hypothetical protein
MYNKCQANDKLEAFVMRKEDRKAECSNHLYLTLYLSPSSMHQGRKGSQRYKDWEERDETSSFKRYDHVCKKSKIIYQKFSRINKTIQQF